MKILNALVAALALSLASGSWVRPSPEEGTWSSPAPMVQEQGPSQGADRADDPPAVEGVGALLTLLAFLVVMLVVPWLMAREGEATERGPAKGGPADARSAFTSQRERRLWLWTLAVLVAVYSTLGPVAELAAALRERNLLRLTSAAVLLLVVVALAVPWARRRPGRREVGAAVGVAAVYLTTMIRIPVPEARSHLFEYGLVAMLIHQALSERRRNGRRVPVPALMALVAAAALGWVDEGIQAFIPSRTYDLLDVGFNALAAFMAIMASLVMAWARRGPLPPSPS